MTTIASNAKQRITFDFNPHSDLLNLAYLDIWVKADPILAFIVLLGIQWIFMDTFSII